MRRGFTLIEVMVVIAIIAILASIVLTVVSTARGRARDTKRVSDMEQLKRALELYYSDHNQYPNPPIDNTFGLSCWDCLNDIYRDINRLADLGNYLNPRPTDPLLASNPDQLKGYWYQTDTSRQNYKVYLIGVVEATSSIPVILLNTDFGGQGMNFYIDAYEAVCENDDCDGLEEFYNSITRRSLSIASSEEIRQSWQFGSEVNL